MKKIAIVFFVLISLFTIQACTTQYESFDVYSTVYPIQFLVERIGENVVSSGLVPGVTNHHDSVDWSAQDIKAMINADFLFYVGVGFDPYIDQKFVELFQNRPVQLIKIETAKDQENQPYVELIEGVVHDHEHANESEIHGTDSELGMDPHFWMSPKRMIQAARLVYETLIQKYPGSQSTLQNNYQVLVSQLTALSNQLQEAVDTQKKVVLTATNIYGYLRVDYGFDSLSISPGYHEETEQFTVQEKDEIVQEAIYHQIKYILYEKNTSSPLSNSIFQALETQGHQPVKLEYHILHNLFQDDYQNNRDYFSIMTQNISLLQTAMME